MNEHKRQSKLIGLLAELNISHTDVAKALGITRESLAHRLHGRIGFGYSEAIRLCDLLNIDNPRDYFVV